MFFGIEVKAIRIGQSEAAPMFDIVAELNSWAKEVRSFGGGSFESEKSKFYAEFWRSLIDAISPELPEFASRTAWGRNWLPSGAGLSGVNLNLVFWAQGLRAKIYFGAAQEDLNTERFEAVLNHKPAIEKTAGHGLSWETLGGKKASRIALYGPAGDISDISKWPTYRSWFSNALKLIKEIGIQEVLPAVKRVR
jgi:hypothetical protein